MVQDGFKLIDTTATALHVEVAHDPAVFITLRDEWEGLMACAPRATGCHSPDWLGTWWRIFGGQNELWLLLVRDAGGTLIGLFPLHLKRYGVWPLYLRQLRWLGHGFRRGLLTETPGPIFRSGYETATTRVVLDYLRLHSQEWDLLDLIRTPSSLTQEILSWARDACYQETIHDYCCCFYIHLPDDWSSLRSCLSKHLRRDLSAYRKRLQQEGYHESFVILTRPEVIMAALPQLFALHRLRAQAQNMKKHTDYFHPQANRVFVHEVAPLLSAQGRLALAQLMIDGTVVAVQLLLFQGQVMSVLYSGFDPQWSAYRVMKLLMQQCVEYAITQGIRCVDLTAGASQTKRQWGNEEVLMDRVQIIQPSPVNALSAYAIRAGSKVTRILNNLYRYR